jgi:hypothetical protein
MKFLCAGYFDPARMDALPKAEVESVMSQCPPHMAALHRTKKVIVEAGVDLETKFVRRVGDEVEATDAQLGAGGEKIGCVFIIEAADMAEAVRVASLHPTTQIRAGENLGWRTEIRPIHYYYSQAEEQA